MASFTPPSNHLSPISRTKHLSWGGATHQGFLLSGAFPHPFFFFFRTFVKKRLQLNKTSLVAFKNITIECSSNFRMIVSKSVSWLIDLEWGKTDLNGAPACCDTLYYCLVRSACPNWTNILPWESSGQATRVLESQLGELCQWQGFQFFC